MGKEVRGLYQGALILEGGGFRGVYTAGVLDYLMDQNIQFSDVYGISAGACNALNYLSQNRGRYIKVAKNTAMTHVIWVSSSW